MRNKIYNNFHIEEGENIRKEIDANINVLKENFKGLEADTETAISKLILSHINLIFILVDSNKMMKEMIASFVSEKIKDIEFSINTKIVNRIEQLENNSEVHNKHFENLEERFEILRAKVDKSDSIMRNIHEVVEKLDSKVTKNSGLLDETKTLLIKTIGTFSR